MNDRRLLTPAGWLAFIVAGALLLVLIPVLNLATTPGSAWHLPDYLVPLLGKYLCFALLAVSLDLVWGMAGILSLGHGAFFALGGYAIGMHLMRLIGPRGVYGHPTLPDFMVFLGYRELPWYWWGFDHFPFALLMALAVPGVLATVVGFLAFRSRITCPNSSDVKSYPFSRPTFTTSVNRARALFLRDSSRLACSMNSLAATADIRIPPQ